MLTERQAKICKKYSKRDEDGYVHCKECPLVLSIDYCVCKAFYHYDRHEREWVPDEDVT